MPALTPPSIVRPFARYAHGVRVAGGTDLIFVSGQLGKAVDGTVPPSAEAQAAICFANITAILAEAEADPSHIVKLTAFVTDRAHMAGYMAARDAWFGASPPAYASTLLIVAGFTLPEFLVEVEAIAAIP
ncbi:MAG: RidA family protein, partial [Pseudomonadota bacterium]